MFLSRESNDLYFLQEETFPSMMDERIKNNPRNGFPVRCSLVKTLHPVSRMLSALEMNLTSSSLSLSDQLEYVVHLPPLSIFLLLVSMKVCLFGKIHDIVAAVFSASFFVIIQLEHPSLQCFPVRLDVGFLNTNFLKFHIFCQRIFGFFSNDSFAFDTDLSQDSCQIQFFLGSTSSGSITSGSYPVNSFCSR